MGDVIERASAAAASARNSGPEDRYDRWRRRAAGVVAAALVLPLFLLMLYSWWVLAFASQEADNLAAKGELDSFGELGRALGDVLLGAGFFALVGAAIALAAGLAKYAGSGVRPRWRSVGLLVLVPAAIYLVAMGGLAVVHFAASR